MIHVNVSLYGSLARFGGGRYVAQVNIKLEPNSGKAELLKHLGVPEDERGYLFINAVLCEVPGISTGANEQLNDGDHIGIFSVDRLYPYQYRDGLPMSDGLKQTLKEHGAMHHSYRQIEMESASFGYSETKQEETVTVQTVCTKENQALF